MIKIYIKIYAANVKTAVKRGLIINGSYKIFVSLNCSWYLKENSLGPCPIQPYPPYLSTPKPIKDSNLFSKFDNLTLSFTIKEKIISVVDVEKSGTFCWLLIFL